MEKCKTHPKYQDIYEPRPGPKRQGRRTAMIHNPDCPYCHGEPGCECPCHGRRKQRILRVDPGILLFGIRVRLNPLWVGVFIGKLGLVVVGDGKVWL